MTDIRQALLGTLAVRPDLAGTGSAVRLYTNVAMAENLAWYPRRGYHETGPGTVDGYDRVQFAKPI